MKNDATNPNKIIRRADLNQVAAEYIKKDDKLFTALTNDLAQYGQALTNNAEIELFRDAYALAWNRACKAFAEAFNV